MPRPRLLNRLNQGVHKPVTLVSAPAGYGKSTLLSAWLETFPGQAAWLSLDARDNQLALFLTYFVAAVRTAWPRACPKTLRLTEAAHLPLTSRLATLLINELNAYEGRDTLASPKLLPRTKSLPFILVLDDFHTIREHAILELLSEFLSQSPQTMHLWSWPAAGILSCR